MSIFPALVKSLSYESSAFPRIVDRVSRSHIWAGLSSRPFADDELDGALASALSKLSLGAINALIRNPSCFYALLQAVKFKDPSLIKLVTGYENRSKLRSSGVISVVSGAPTTVISTLDDEDDNRENVISINKSIDIIRERAPLAAAGIARYAAEIQFYNDTSIDGFSSASNNQWHRRIQIINFRSHEVSICRLADALVHESIHSYLYSLELEMPLVSGENIHDLILSPWSGRKLKIHSYIHACFVWYALALFWSRPGFAVLGEEHEPSRLRARASRGFDGRNVADPLIPYSRFLAAGLIECISALDVSSAQRT